MREDFKCSCGHSFEYDFREGKEKTLNCPKCKQLWKVQTAPGGLRMLMWV